MTIPMDASLGVANTEENDNKESCLQRCDKMML